MEHEVNYEEIKDAVRKVTGPLKMDLQFFAEGDSEGGSGEGSGGGSGEGQGEGSGNTNVDTEGGSEGSGEGSGEGKKTDGSGESKNTSAEKLFSQEDVNSIATKEAKKAQNKILKQLGMEDTKSAKEALTKLKEYQDAEKSDADKASERAASLEKSNKSLQDQNDNLNAQVTAMKKDVDPGSVDDVVVLAKSKVNDDKDIDEAMDEVLEQYPHFKREQANTESNDDDKKKKKKPKFSEGEHNTDKKEKEEDAWKNAFNWGQK